MEKTIRHCLHQKSDFMENNTPHFLRRYDLTYSVDECCVDYFLLDHHSHNQVSYALILSLNRYAKQLHVSKFYPELNKQSDTKYFSATCFCLLIEHFAHYFNLSPEYTIHLETKIDVYNNFYKKLKDFHFEIKRRHPADNVDLISSYLPHSVDTSVVIDRKKDNIGVYLDFDY